MPLQNVEIHQNCFCYDSKNSVVELIRLDRDDSDCVDLYTHVVLFVLQGVLHVSTSERYRLTLRQGEFIFLPAGTTIYYEALVKSVSMLMRIHSDVPECHIFQVGKIGERIVDQYEGIYPLKANERMQGLLAHLRETYDDGLRCRQYLQMEVSRMLYLIHAYYPQEDCLKFFSQILSPNVKFSEYVRTNWMNYGNVKEFAAGIHMSPQQFSNRFRKVFGTTPHDWVIQQKAKRIYQDICRSDLPLKEIALKYEFSSQANFFHFCKHVFGNTPGQIRKSLKYDSVVA